MFALYGSDMWAAAARGSQAPQGCDKTMRTVFSGQLANCHQLDRLTLRVLKQQQKKKVQLSCGTAERRKQANAACNINYVDVHNELSRTFIMCVFV